MPLSTSDVRSGWLTALTVFGAALLAIAGFLLYSTYGRPVEGGHEAVGSHDYSIKQSLSPNVQYLDNSFFDTPVASNTAYITALTEAINTQYKYEFDAPNATDVSYRYSANATIKALYSDKSAVPGEGSASVWQRTETLVEPRALPAPRDTGFAISPTFTVPFMQYRQEMERLNDTLNLSLGSEVVVAVTVTVSGQIKDEEFTDTRTATMKVPLNQQLYTITTEADKEYVGTVRMPGMVGGLEQRDYIRLGIAGIIAALGIGCIVFGLRRRVGGTQYERELNRIYRYHDGIIVRTSKTAKLVDKNVVEVDSFDDMLNLEEELKVPIIATYAGPQATRFMAIHNDVAYVYTLGTVRQTLDRPATTLAEDDDAIIDEIVAKANSRKSAPKKKPAKRVATKKK